MSFRNALVALDLEPESIATLEWAKALVEPGGTIHVLHVGSPDARPRLEALAKKVSGVAVEIAFATGAPASAIVEAADRIPVDLVVVGAHGKGAIDRLRLGSVSEEVARTSNAPVIVVEDPSPERPLSVEKVVVAIDLDDTSKRAAQVASGIATRLAKPLEAVHVVEFRDLPLPITGSFDATLTSEETRRVIEHVPGALERALVEAGVAHAGIRVLGGSVRDELVRAVTERDVIVCGTHGRSGIGRVVFGSVAVSLLRNAPCPVCVVRPGSR